MDSTGLTRRSGANSCWDKTNFYVTALLWLWVALLGFSQGHAQTTVPLIKIPVRYMDIPIKAFGGAFEASGVPGCIYDVNEWMTGLVADTLGFDSLTGRKRLLSGNKSVCGQGIESWFDPQMAANQRCGDLTLEPSLQNPLAWEFLDTLFFPVDDISQDIGLIDRNGNKTQHDFSHCLEAHAAITYRGGETFDLRSDDDMWVFIDNRLAADMGGVHFGLQKRLELDSLPFLQAKKGHSLDVDFFYCSRQPPTAILGIVAPLELRSRSLQSLSIRDTLGQAMKDRPTVIGRTKVCAWPAYEIPKTPDCGNETPPTAAVPALWKINGETLIEKAACIELDPVRFADQARITVTAEAEGRLARVALTLVRVAKVNRGTLVGDGQALSVQLQLDSTSGSVGAGLQVDFNLAGKQHRAWAEPTASASGAPLSPLHGLLNPSGEIGLTDIASLSATVTQYLLGQVFRQTVMLDDGVKPILKQARLQGTEYLSGKSSSFPPTISSVPGSQNTDRYECGSFSAALDLDLSEPILPEGLALGVFIAKFKHGESIDLGAHAAQCLVVDSEKRRLLLPDGFAVRFRVGDSLSLGSMAQDSSGNRAALHFVAIDLPGHSQVTVGETHVVQNPAFGHAFAPVMRQPVLVPVSLTGEPLRNHALDQVVILAHGPVFSWRTPAPLAEICVNLYDQFGQFVAKVSHSFSNGEWEAYVRQNQGISDETPEVRLMLYPISSKGQRLGTGVYIAKVEGKVRDASLIHVNGKWTQVMGSNFSLPPIRFGYVRAD